MAVHPANLFPNFLQSSQGPTTYPTYHTYPTYPTYLFTAIPITFSRSSPFACFFVFVFFSRFSPVFKFQRSPAFHSAALRLAAGDRQAASPRPGASLAPALMDVACFASLGPAIPVPRRLRCAPHTPLGRPQCPSRTGSAASAREGG